MSSSEQRSVGILSLLFAIRMLGLFMILPTFTLYAHFLTGVTPTLIGIALGVYGFTQACFQIPLGMLSDRIGRKQVILIGLGLLILGSLIAAFSTHIYGVIIGRMLQGAGAIGSTLLALLADLTKPENRSKAMAMMGATIGVSFTLAMLIGPPLTQVVNIAGIFGVTALLAGLGIVIVYTLLPTPPTYVQHPELQTSLRSLKEILGNTQLLKLDFGIFILHLILTASFVVLPVILTNIVPSHNTMALIYAPVLILAFLTMLPILILAEKWAKSKQLLVIAIVLLIISLFLFWEAHDRLPHLIFAMYLFFLAFNTLEASLPALMTKLAPPTRKGTAMGIYSTAQFMGIFAGGLIGGWFYANAHLGSIFLFLSALTCIWLAMAFNMPTVKALRHHMVSLPEDLSPESQAALRAKFEQLLGVEQVEFDARQPIAYLTVDINRFNPEDLSEVETET